MDILAMVTGHFYIQYDILYSKAIGNPVPGVLIPYRCFLLRSRTAVETVKHGMGKKRMNRAKRNFDRCLAVLLCVFLMLSSISVTAFAEGIASGPADSQIGGWNGFYGKWLRILCQDLC